MSDLWRVRTAISGGSGAAQLSTMFFDQSAGLTVQDAANAVHSFWTTLAPKISGAYSMQVQTTVESIDYTTGHPTGVSPVTATVVPGSAATDAAPWQTQGLISWHSGVFLGGREVRGRTFVPGVTVGFNSSGVPTAAYLTTLNSAATTLLSDPLSAFVIYSRKKAAIGVVNSAAAWTKWAVLRSRRD